MLVMVILTAVLTAGLTISTLRITRLQFVQDKEIRLKAEAVANSQLEYLYEKLSLYGSEQETIAYFKGPVEFSRYGSYEADCDADSWADALIDSSYEFCLRRIGYTDNMVASTPRLRDAFEIRVRSKTPGKENFIASEQFSLEAPYASVTKIVPPELNSADQFGESVDADGNTIVVSAIADTETGIGRVFVFDWNAATQSWDYQIIVDPEGEPKGRFGSDVSISGDHLAVGAWINDSDSDSAVDVGKVYVFERQPDNSWLLDAEFQPNTGDWLLQEGDVFGRSVAIYEHPNGITWLAVGAPRKERLGVPEVGAVYIYQLDSGVWSLFQTISETASEPFSHFGSDVALSYDTLAIGIPDRTVLLNTGRGMIFTYYYDSGTDMWEGDDDVYNMRGSTDYQFGYSINLENKTLVAGEPGNANPDNPPDTAVPGSTTRAGAGYIFDISGVGVSSWVYKKRVYTVPHVAQDEYGISIDIKGNVVVVGSGAEDEFVTINEKDLRHSDDVWYQRVRLPGIYDTAIVDDEYGSAVAISDRWLVVGAKFDDTEGPFAGAIYIYER